MKWGWICVAFGKGSNAEKISVRKLERKRQSGGRRSFWGTVLKLILNWV
jgi:hypothetical protein